MTLLWIKGRLYRELSDEEVSALPLEDLPRRPGAGTHPEFLRRVQDDRQELIATGDPHPNKTLAERYGVDASTMSRWLNHR